jgi:hypothetical protein
LPATADLIEDHGFDAVKKGSAAFTGEHYVKAFWGGNQDFRRMPQERSPFICRGVAAPGHYADVGEGLSGLGKIAGKFL